MKFHTFMYGLYRDIANFETEQSNILDKIKTKVNRNNNDNSFKNKILWSSHSKITGHGKI